MRQTRLPIDWIVEAEESSSSSEEYEEEVKRGRPVQPLQWTRVKSLKLIKEQKLMVYDGTKDLAFDKNLKVIRKQAAVDGGEFLFDPSSFKEEARTFSIESSKLSQEELLKFGKLATELRARFRAKAASMSSGDAADKGDDELKHSGSIMKLKRGCKKERQQRKVIVD